MATRFKPALALATLSVLQFISLARLIVTKMTGNASFTTPDPPLLSITNAANALETAKNNVEIARTSFAQAVATQTTADQTLHDLVSNEAKYVDIKANGSKTIIESAGMGASDEPGPVGDMPQVEALSLSRGDNPGEVDAHWHSVKKRKNYTVQVTADPLGSAAWITRGNPTKSSITIDGLTSGSKVWVQVCANGTAGAGPFSDPAVIVVP
jgi:hypothetical protein